MRSVVWAALLVALHAHIVTRRRRPTQAVPARDTVTTGSAFDVVFHTPGSLGLQLSPSLEVLAFVRTPEGQALPAEASGLLRRHDRLIGVNGVDLSHSSFTDATRVLAKARLPRALRFVRLGVGDAPSSVRTPLDDFNVTFDGNDRLGLVLDDGLFVTEVVPGFEVDGVEQVSQAAASAAVVSVGDRVMALDGEPLVFLPVEAALGRLREAFAPVPAQQVVCRSTPDNARYCARQPVARVPAPHVLRFRPAPPPPVLAESEATQAVATPRSGRDVGAVRGAATLFDTPRVDRTVTTCGPMGCSFSTSGGVVEAVPRGLAFPPRHGAALPTTLGVEFAAALFGGAFPCAPRRLVAASPIMACSQLADRRLRGAVALVRRGDCYFTQKARVLQDAGAVAMVVIDSDDSPLARMPGGDSSSIVIAAGMVSRSSGGHLLAMLDTAPDGVRARFGAPGTAACVEHAGGTPEPTQRAVSMAAHVSSAGFAESSEGATALFHALREQKEAAKRRHRGWASAEVGMDGTTT